MDATRAALKHDQTEHSKLDEQIGELAAAGVFPDAVDAVRRNVGLDAPPQVVVDQIAQLSIPRYDTEPVVAFTQFPPRLAETWSFGGPLWLWCRGRLPLAGFAVGIVGTRNATADGLALARTLGRDLAEAGVTVVSGLAKGIDQAAHRGALDANGTTVAVLGTGYDVDYPSGSAALHDAVAASGAVVTEYPPDHGIRHRRQFLARNRILAGLSDAVVVVEAGQRSGALNTASWAERFGRDVMVVPASPSTPTAAGTLALLIDGAIPVRDATDVLTAFGHTVVNEPTRLPTLPDDPVARDVAKLLSTVPVSASKLAAHTGHPVSEVLVALTVLEETRCAVGTTTGYVAVTPV